MESQKTPESQKTAEKMSQLQRENYNQSYKPHIITKKVMQELEERLPKDKAILDCGCIACNLLTSRRNCQNQRYSKDKKLFRPLFCLLMSRKC